MKELELEILLKITNNFSMGIDTCPNEIFQLLFKLLDDPFELLSKKFIHHSVLADFIISTQNFFAKAERIKSQEIESWNFILLRLRIEYYLDNKSKENLNQIESALKNSLLQVTSADKAQGMAILPDKIVNPKFIRDLYLLEDNRLTDILIKYLPFPQSHLFTNRIVPKIIARQEEMRTKVIKNVMARAEELGQSAQFENAIITAQRKIRANIRKQEESARISARYQLSPADTQALVDDANSLYVPKCQQGLSARILKAVKKIQLFTTVKHQTSTSAVQSIFDDGLLGRRNLVNSYRLFKPGNLQKIDILNGDANSICFGANFIDLPSYNIELEFDAKKISANNPCVFYKQRDFGLWSDDKPCNEVTIGDLTILFSHIFKGPCDFRLFSFFTIFSPFQAQTEIEIPLLISYNVEQMHQILTLNFFRFIDKFEPSRKSQIYLALAQLNEASLIQTLRKIGIEMTNTMELNIYGAHQINFSSLLNITRINKAGDRFYLNLPDFIAELNQGKLHELKQGLYFLPQIFNSYRFLDYLLANVTNNDAISQLTDLRNNCVLPAWLQDKKESSCVIM